MPRRSRDRFARWFGDTEDFELVEASVGEVGAGCTCSGGCGCGRSGSALAGSPSSSRPTPTPATAAASPGSTCCARATGPRAAMTDTLTTWGGWAPAIRDDPFGHFAAGPGPVPGAAGAPGRRSPGLGGARLRRGPPGAGRPPDLQGHARRAGGRRRGGGRGAARAGVLPAHAQRRPARSHPAAAAGIPGLYPGRVAALEPAIRGIAGSLLDELDAAGPGAAVDLIEGYAYPLPFGGDRRTAGHPGSRPAARCTPGSRCC